MGEDPGGEAFTNSFTQLDPAPMHGFRECVKSDLLRSKLAYNERTAPLAEH